MKQQDITGYKYSQANLSNSHAYLLPAVEKTLSELAWMKNQKKSLFEIGCGNGSVAYELSRLGYDVTGVDPSSDGIEIARKNHPSLNLHQGSAYDDLANSYGTYAVVLSLEVVEHLYAPRSFAKTVFELTKPGGTAIVSTPYHGYWKNLAMALSGKMEKHYSPLWDHGHIKFWSVNTLTKLLREAGFEEINFLKVGRVPPIAKSMIAVARRN